MSNLKISRYRLTYQAVSPLALPVYAGSSLRGAFGHALKSICCLSATENKGVCRCNPVETCLYRQLFDPPKQVVQFEKEQIVPAPLVIEPVTQNVFLQPGETGILNLVVIGQAAHQQLSIIQLAWQRAFFDGVGLSNDYGQRGKASLVSMQLLDQPCDPPPENPGYIKMQLLSPLRLQYRGNIVSDKSLNASILILAIFRRKQLMESLYGDKLFLNYESIFSAIDQITMHTQLTWMNWTRWSNRQKREMQLSGFMGSIELEHINNDFWPALYLGQWLHAGKNSLFGLGQYQIQDKIESTNILESS